MFDVYRFGFAGQVVAFPGPGALCVLVPGKEDGLLALLPIVPLYTRKGVL
jgi:hypothetical protein